MLTNRATRLGVSQGHKTWYYSTIMYGFLLVCYSKFVRKTQNISETTRYRATRSVEW